METAMPPRKDIDELYRKTLAEIRRQSEDVDRRIEDEIKAVKARLASLQEMKKSLLAAGAGIAKVLGEVFPEAETDGSAAERQIGLKERRSS